MRRRVKAAKGSFLRSLTSDNCGRDDAEISAGICGGDSENQWRVTCGEREETRRQMRRAQQAAPLQDREKMAR